MGRKAKGREILESAKAYLTKARTAEALRQAQAVVFPLEYGMSMEQTAKAIGVSPGWACQLRNRFMKEGSISEAGKPLRGGRRRENMSIEEERAFLLPFFERAKAGGFLVEELNRYAVVFANLPLSDQDKLFLDFIQSGFFVRSC
jgi:hypothetical protein